MSSHFVYVCLRRLFAYTLLASIFTYCVQPTPTNHFVHVFHNQFKRPTLLFIFFTTNSSNQLFCICLHQPISPTNSNFANHFVFLTTTCLSNSTTNSANRFPLPHHNQFSQLIFLHNRFANQQPPQPTNSF